MEIDSLRRLARCSRLEKVRSNITRKQINIKNPVSEYIRYNSWAGMASYEEWMEKGYLENFCNGVHLEEEEKEDLKIREFRK